MSETRYNEKEEAFLKDYFPNHTDGSKWNKSEFLSALSEFSNQQLQAEKKRVEKIGEYLNKVDETLMHWEDYFHGEEGKDVTEARFNLNEANKLLENE